MHNATVILVAVLFGALVIGMVVYTYLERQAQIESVSEYSYE